MLKTAKIIQPASFTAKDIGKDMVNAILLSVDESMRSQLQQAIEGRVVYIAQLIMDYHKATSGGDWMTAQRDARQALELMADEMAESLNVANMLPSNADEFPTDHAGLFNLLTLADNQVQFNPGTFDTGDINKWMNMLSQDQIDQVRAEMIESGVFTTDDRYRDFIGRTKFTMEFYENLAREKAAERAGKEELKLQKAQEDPAMAPETNIGDITDPAFRQEIEDRAKAQAEAEAREQQKAVAKEQGRIDLYNTTMKPTGVPGLDAFLEDINRIAYRSAGPDDEEMRQQIMSFQSAAADFATKNPEGWEAGVVEIMGNYPKLVDLTVEMQKNVDEMRYKRDQRVKAPNRPPEEMTPESQKADELPADVNLTQDPDPLNPTSGLITKNQEYDAHKGQGPWELDKEAKAIRRRKIMVANAVFGRPPVPFAIGETVGFSRGSALDSGKIIEIKAEKFVIETSKDKVEIPHEAVFETASTELF